MVINDKFNLSNDITIFSGDCFNLFKQIPDNSIDLIITSPPYCMGKAYESVTDDINTFKNQLIKIFPEMYRVLDNNGSICWQIGYHVNHGSIIPLDYFVYQIFLEESMKIGKPMILRNRIIWTFGHGLNGSQRFSGRHETILWFTKSNNYKFDLDSVRIPQKYPGKKSYRGKNKGAYSGNPLGKNPSDVWDIPNVKANHIEKTVHPCQFPVSIPQRLIKALTDNNGLIFDPYMGSGTTGVAAVLEGRKFVGAEIINEYYDIAKRRISDAIDGNARIRNDIPVIEPDINLAVAKLPIEFQLAREGVDNEKK